MLNMKKTIIDLIHNAAEKAYENNELSSPVLPDAKSDIKIEEPRAASHGDFSTNISMVMASGQKMPPRKIAQTIVKHFVDPENTVSRIEIAGPGFINFFINPSSWHSVMRSVHAADTRYGACDIGKGEKIFDGQSLPGPVISARAWSGNWKPYRGPVSR